MKKLSIIIVTYNSLKDILNCIDSIYEYSDLQVKFLEIIVVDNSNIDVFITMNKMICDKYGEKVQVIHNSENKGYGQGNNVGIKHAQSEIICIINPDVLLQKPVFMRVLNHFNKDPNLAMIGGKQFGGINLSFWIRPEFEFFIFTTLLCLLLNKINVYFQRLFFLSGALLFIDKSKFLDIGMFDENLFLYCEEADVIKRFLKKNYKTRFDKTIVYKHLIDEREDITEYGFKTQMNSIKYYLQKYKYSFPHFIRKRLLSYRLLFFLSKILMNKNIQNKSLKNMKLLNEI